MTEDTVERQVLQGGKLRSVRFLTKTGAGLPRWAENFVPHKLVAIIEESIVDPQKQTLTTYTRNIGYSKIIVSIFHSFVTPSEIVNCIVLLFYIHRVLLKKLSTIKTHTIHIKQLLVVMLGWNHSLIPAS